MISRQGWKPKKGFKKGTLHFFHESTFKSHSLDDTAIQLLHNRWRLHREVAEGGQQMW